MNDSIVAFLNELRNYPFYKLRVKQLKEMLNEQWYQMEGVKGISFDRVKGNISQEQKYINRDAMSQKVDKLEKEISKYQANVNNIESVLNKLNPETKEAILDIYCRGKTYNATAKRLLMSKGALQYRINKELNNIF